MSLYSWKEGIGYHHTVTAETAAKELQRLQLRSPLTLQAVVDASRPMDAPLHPEFEWDDAVAAEEYRKDQARHLIDHIVIQYERTDAQPLQVRAWTNVREGKASQYIPIQVGMSEPEIRSKILETAWKELDAFRKRYSDLEQLARLFVVMDEIREAAG